MIDFLFDFFNRRQENSREQNRKKYVQLWCAKTFRKAKNRFENPNKSRHKRKFRAEFVVLIEADQKQKNRKRHTTNQAEFDDFWREKITDVINYHCKNRNNFQIIVKIRTRFFHFSILSNFELFENHFCLCARKMLKFKNDSER